MNQAGVWSFRTRTGVARVVGGRLRIRHTLGGVIVGTYDRINSGSLLQSFAATFGAVGVVGPIQTAVETITQGSLPEPLSLGVASLIALAGLLAVSTLWTVFNRPAAVDVYDIRAVTVDDEENEVTIEYVDDEIETTTLEARNEAALDEALTVFELKGTPVKR